LLKLTRLPPSVKTRVRSLCGMKKWIIEVRNSSTLFNTIKTHLTKHCRTKRSRTQTTDVKQDEQNACHFIRQSYKLSENGARRT
jgi:hypothetical protein